MVCGTGLWVLLMIEKYKYFGLWYRSVVSLWSVGFTITQFHSKFKLIFKSAAQNQGFNVIITETDYFNYSFIQNIF